MDFSNKEIYNYIDNHSSDESDILYELRRETELKCLNPIMLSGKIQGNFLAIISKLITQSGDELIAQSGDNLIIN